MRLWHYKLLPYLPKSQLLAQWRELNCIFKNENKHILINYIYKYDKSNLYTYTSLVIREMKARGYMVYSRDNINEYFKTDEDKKLKDNLFKNNHTNRYLLQCFINLQEKHFAGQLDFSSDIYIKLYNFVNEELGGLLDMIKDKTEPKYVLDAVSNEEVYILFENGEQLLRISKRSNTLEDVKKALAYYKIEDYELLV